MRLVRPLFDEFRDDGGTPGWRARRAAPFVAVRIGRRRFSGGGDWGTWSDMTFARKLAILAMFCWMGSVAAILLIPVLTIVDLAWKALQGS